MPIIFLRNLWWQTSSLRCSSAVNAQLSHPQRRMLITTASYSQTLSFTGIISLHRKRFIVAKAPFAWVICRCILRSSFNDRVKIVPRYLNLSVYEKTLNSFIIISAVLVVVAVFPGGWK